MSKRERFEFSDTFIQYDWTRAWSVGCQLALERSRRGDEISKESVMWALLVDAAETARLAYRAPPRSGMPSKSAMPDALDDMTEWQKISAYLRGEIEDMPESESTPPRPGAEQVTRADMVLELWHKVAMFGDGDRARMRKAVYFKACGVKDRKVRAVTGYSRQRIHAAKDRAMGDMLRFITTC